jgi:hypothetical protein
MAAAQDGWKLQAYNNQIIEGLCCVVFKKQKGKKLTQCDV